MLTKLEQNLTELHLTLTRVVFEFKLLLGHAKDLPYLTLTRVVFEFLFCDIIC